MRLLSSMWVVSRIKVYNIGGIDLQCQCDMLNFFNLMDSNMMMNPPFWQPQQHIGSRILVLIDKNMLKSCRIQTLAEAQKTQTKMLIIQVMMPVINIPNMREMSSLIGLLHYSLH